MFGFMTLCAEAAERKFEGDWTVIWSTVVTGLVVVFLILVLLVFILMLMGKILSAGSKKPDKTESVQIAAAPVVQQNATVEEAEEYEDDGELIAVISAAIAAYGEADGKQYKVVGVRRQRDKALRSGWSAAGISDNMRPF